MVDHGQAGDVTRPMPSSAQTHATSAHSNSVEADQRRKKKKRQNSVAFSVEAVRWSWTGVRVCSPGFVIVPRASLTLASGRRGARLADAVWEAIATDSGGPLPSSCQWNDWRLSTAASRRTLTGGGAFTVGRVCSESRRAVPRQQRTSRPPPRCGRARSVSDTRRVRDVKVRDHRRRWRSGGAPRWFSPRAYARVQRARCAADSPSWAHRRLALSAVCDTRRPAGCRCRSGRAPADAPPRVAVHPCVGRRQTRDRRVVAVGRRGPRGDGERLGCADRD